MANRPADSPLTAGVQRLSLLTSLGAGKCIYDYKPAFQKYALIRRCEIRNWKTHGCFFRNRRTEATEAGTLAWRPGLAHSKPMLLDEQTSPEQIAILRRMTPERRLALAEGLYWTAREMKQVWLRAQHSRLVGRTDCPRSHPHFLQCPNLNFPCYFCGRWNRIGGALHCQWQRGFDSLRRTASDE